MIPTKSFYPLKILLLLGGILSAGFALGGCIAPPVSPTASPFLSPTPFILPSPPPSRTPAPTLTLFPFPGEPMPFQTIAQSEYPGTGEPYAGQDVRLEVISTLAEAGRLGGWVGRDDTARLAAVDYSSYFVLAVFQGEEPSSGYGIEIREVRRQGDSVALAIQLQTPAPDVIVNAIMTSPYHLVQVEKSGNWGKDVTFNVLQDGENILSISHFIPSVATPAPPSGQELLFETIAQSYSPGTGEPYAGTSIHLEVISTLAEAASLGGWIDPDASNRLAAVDYSHSFVLALFQGNKPTDGYSIEIIRIQRQGDSIALTIRLQTPLPGSSANDVITSPYHLVRVEKSGQWGKDIPFNVLQDGENVLSLSHFVP